MRNITVKAMAIPVGNKILDNSVGLVNNGDITPAVNQAAAIIFRNSDKTFSWLGFKSLIITHFITNLTIITRYAISKYGWQKETIC